MRWHYTRCWLKIDMILGRFCRVNFSQSLCELFARKYKRFSLSEKSHTNMTKGTSSEVNLNYNSAKRSLAEQKAMRVTMMFHAYTLHSLNPTNLSLYPSFSQPIPHYTTLSSLKYEYKGLWPLLKVHMMISVEHWNSKFVVWVVNCPIKYT